VRKEFKEAKKTNKIIDDRDIQRWAHQINKEFKVSWFKASQSSVRDFKIANRIRSRKITHTITYKNAQSLLL